MEWFARSVDGSHGATRNAERKVDGMADRLWQDRDAFAANDAPNVARLNRVTACGERRNFALDLADAFVVWEAELEFHALANDNRRKDA